MGAVVYSVSAIGFSLGNRLHRCLALLICALKCFNGIDCSGESINPSEKSDVWWSLRSVQKPEVPAVNGASWAVTPVDRFILSRLEDKGLKPSPLADKRTVLRRVTFDLTGLPPTPEDLRNFEGDSSADAYAKVVDRLLGSSRYGERFARHWMDLVHYAETHGHDQDRIRTNAWPYRDYLIRSFNEDKPYGRFVEEQVAGDVLFPEDPQATLALGFLATGPWDESSLRDIREDTIDRQVARYLDRDDIVMTTMTTFTSATVHCARCHDHKFDPITKEEYYGLQAVFAATDKANRYFDTDPRIHLKRQSLLKQRADLDRRPDALVEDLLSAATQAQVSAWENDSSDPASVWTVLEPETYSASGDVVLTKLDDQSLLSSGPLPERAVYSVTASTSIEGITGIRLEVFSDARLPKHGPGRQDNGNFHLSEFQIQFETKGNGAEPRLKTPVELQNASADFDQDGWRVDRSIDGKTDTAWGVFPDVGRSHVAVFETKQHLGSKNGATLHFELNQNHGGGHLIGRFRLSATTAPRPLRVLKFPVEISKIFAIPATDRSRDQALELAVYFRKQQIEKQLSDLPPAQIVYAGASDFVPDGSFKPTKIPRAVHVLRRGNIDNPGALATPGALSCVEGLESTFRVDSATDEGERRAALAKWISSSKNPLTWRSIANRIWQYHFGRGIVDTPNDFGQMGSEPSHLELLDWLAAYLLENGGSLKNLHRLIVTSAVYRQSSQFDSASGAIDADNRFLWRANRSRLEAESVYDAVLQISGELDLRMGGPSDKHFALSPGIHVTPVVDYSEFDLNGPEARRRSVYRFIFRTLPDPFMDVLDCADASQITAKRNVSVTPLQALSMLNNPFMVHFSERFASRVAESAMEMPDRVRAACQLTFGREPSEEEVSLMTEYAGAHGLANLCRFLLNSNEFMFVN